jgi:hypothetical protein
MIQVHSVKVVISILRLFFTAPPRSLKRQGQEQSGLERWQIWRSLAAIQKIGFGSISLTVNLCIFSIRRCRLHHRLFPGCGSSLTVIKWEAATSASNHFAAINRLASRKGTWGAS